MSFFKNAFTLAFGTGFSQIIPLILMPVIGRLYTPGDYGIYSFIMSIAIVASVLLSLRFENALILPRGERAASLLLSFVLALTGAGFILTCVLAGLAGLLMPADHPATPWLWLVPVLALFQNLVQTGTMYSNRVQHYKTIAASSVAIQGVYGLLAALAGLSRVGAAGLIYSRIIGQIAGTAMFMRSTWSRLSFRHLSARKIRYFISTYRQFPIFNLPNMLLVTISRESAVLIFAFFGFAHAAGLYGIIRAGLLMPVNFISSSLGQVYAKQATLHLDKPAFRAFTLTLVAALMMILALPFSFFSTHAGDVLGVILGPDWVEAGAYAVIILPLALLQTVTIWLGRVLEITHHQHLGFRLRAIFDVAAMVALAVMLALEYNPLQALAVYAVLLIVYELLLTRTVLKLLDLPLHRFALILAGASALYSLPYLLHSVVAATGFAPLPAFALEGGIMLAFTAAIGLFFFNTLTRKLKF